MFQVIMNLKISASQIIALTIGNLKSRYRKTIAGFLWVVLNPIIMYGVQSFVFKKFLNLNIPNFYIFLASGLLPWIFFIQSIQMCTPLFQSNRDLLKAYHVNPLVILLAQLLDNCINFVFALIVLLGPLYVTYPDVSMGILFLPLTILLIVWGLLGLTWLLAQLNVYFRDTKFIVDFVASVAFWLTPVFYPIEYIPENFRWIIKINLAYYFIDFFRSTIISFNLAAYASKALIVLGLDCILLLVAYGLWRGKRNSFYLSL